MDKSASPVGASMATPASPNRNGTAAAGVPDNIRPIVYMRLLSLKPVLERSGSFQPLPQPGR